MSNGSTEPSETGLYALPFVVIRIRAGERNGSTSTGTGFFYNIIVNGQQVPLIVSNKHVISNKAWIELDFAQRSSDQKRVFGSPKVARINSGQLPIFDHPDPNVDIAAIPLVPIQEALSAQGFTPHIISLSKQNHAPAWMEKHLLAATSVVMVGFPNGIMDEANNLPVVRRGSLASLYSADYQGKSNFVVDIAAFGGSSGSPVFAMFEGMSPTEDGGYTLGGGSAFYFIGLLHSGPVMNARGEIIKVPVPTEYSVANTSVMIHLGYCAKAFQVQELASVIAPLLEAEESRSQPS